MNETVRLGRGNQFIEIPQHTWEEHVSESAKHTKETLSFMSPEHHRVRYFVVDALVRYGEALLPETISKALDLPFDQTFSILDDLEKNLFFLVRNKEGAVVWAYPVTVERTPHRLTFDSGERLYGA
ncbi:MAG: hypothetical protein WA996_05065 [Candidatus Promineifilaceae bacterium]